MDHVTLSKWLALPDSTKRNVFSETAAKLGLPAFVIEKDWWVTTTLHLFFSLPEAEHLVFKGGTSLSKCWGIINRFSEDIDLALDREFLGFKGDLSRTQITKLRKQGCKYISNDLKHGIEKQFKNWQIPRVTISVRDYKDSDKDPMVIEVHYTLLTDPLPYMPPPVKIEISVRSLMEPSEMRKIQSLAGSQYLDRDFADQPAPISAVLPKRTFLEKAFLLHEEFQKSADKIRVNRLSRHIYDLDKLADTNHAKEALNDRKLYNDIIAHRKKFNPVKGIDYSTHQSTTIDFVPPKKLIQAWKLDYEEMQESMFFGESKTFDELIKRMKSLREEFRSSGYD